MGQTLVLVAHLLLTCAFHSAHCVPRRRHLGPRCQSPCTSLPNGPAMSASMSSSRRAPAFSIIWGLGVSGYPRIFCADLVPLTCGAALQVRLPHQIAILVAQIWGCWAPSAAVACSGRTCLLHINVTRGCIRLLHPPRSHLFR